MAIRYNRVKVTANGTDENTDFLLGDPVPSFAAFKTGEVTYTALAVDGTWQVGKGIVSGLNLTRGTVQENSLGNENQMDFSGQILQIAMVLSADYMDDITVKLLTIETGATEDQTGAEIKVLYEAEDDTNAFDDAAKDKLDGVEEYAKDDQNALQVPFTPTTTVTPNDVQNAIENVDYQARNHTHLSINLVYQPDGDEDAIPPFGDDLLTVHTDIQQAMLDHSDYIVDKEPPATGLISGGKLYGSVNTGVFHISAGEGLFSTTYEDDGFLNKPVKIIWEDIIDISISPEADGLNVANLHVMLLRNLNTVSVVKLVGTITASYLKDYIYLGKVNTVNGTITGFTNAPVIARSTSFNLTDLMAKSIKVTGASLYGTTAGLSFWQESGDMYYPGINWHDTDHRNPNLLAFGALGSDISPVLFNVMNQNGAFEYIDITALTAQYDDGGVLTTIPATKCTLHRMYSIGIDAAQRKLVLLLGQNLYDTIELAEEAAGSESIVYPSETDSLQRVGLVGVTAESSDFNGTDTFIISDISSIIGSQGSADALWGGITGLITDQADLIEELDKKINLTGDTLTGQLKGITPVDAEDLTRKDYVDTASKDILTLNDVTGSEPIHAAGQLFYSDKGLNFQGKYPNVTLQIGQEEYIEVANETGATILNGKAVYFSGLSAGTPAVALALADDFITARVIGVATMDIPTGEKGLVTTFGAISELNTNAFLAGNILYLSDISPGDFTDTPPDIASLIGTCLVQDLTEGKLFIKINNLINLPTILAYMKAGDITGTDLDATFLPIETYDSGGNVVMDYNITTGEITIPSTGIYGISINIGMLYDAIGNQEQTVILRVHSTASGDEDVPIQLPRSSAGAAAYPSVNFSATAGDVINLQIACSTANLSGFSFSQMNFTIESKHIR